MGYLRLIPTMFVVLTAFGALFVTVAALLRIRFGARIVWQFWAFYLLAVSASCIYKLSGLRYGVVSATVGRSVYLLAVALVSVGVPLALGAWILTRHRGQNTLESNVRSAGIAWASLIAMTPVSVALVAIVDFVNLIVVSS